MKKVKIIEGFVAEYNGEYWGEVPSHGYMSAYDYSDITTATIIETDKCRDVHSFGLVNGRYRDKLEKATLIKVRKTVTIEIENI